MILLESIGEDFDKDTVTCGTQSNLDLYIDKNNKAADDIEFLMETYPDFLNQTNISESTISKIRDVTNQVTISLYPLIVDIPCER